MNDYERKQAEELAAQRYPYSGKPEERELAQRAFIEGYEAALETVAPEPKDLAPEVEAALDRWNTAHPDLYVAKPVGGDPSFGQRIKGTPVYPDTRGSHELKGPAIDVTPLDPEPYVHECWDDGTCGHIGERRAERGVCDEFRPRDGYSQNLEDYA